MPQLTSITGRKIHCSHTWRIPKSTFQEQRWPLAASRKKRIETIWLLIWKRVLHKLGRMTFAADPCRVNGKRFRHIAEKRMMYEFFIYWWRDRLYFSLIQLTPLIDVQGPATNIFADFFLSRRLIRFRFCILWGWNYVLITLYRFASSFPHLLTLISSFRKEHAADNDIQRLTESRWDSLAFISSTWISIISTEPSLLGMWLAIVSLFLLLIFQHEWPPQFRGVTSLTFPQENRSKQGERKPSLPDRRERRSQWHVILWLLWRYRSVAQE